MDYETYRRIVFPAKNRPCLDCGQRKQGLMTFDHIPSRGKKNFTIGSLSRWRYLKISEEELRNEIALCEVVCRPCHDIRESWRIAFDGFEVMATLASVEPEKQAEDLILEIFQRKRWIIDSLTQTFRVMSLLVAYHQGKEEKKRRRVLEDWAIGFARGCAYLRMKEKNEGLCSNSE